MLNDLFFKKGVYLLGFSNNIEEVLKNKVYVGKTDICFLRRYCDIKSHLEANNYHNLGVQEDFNKHKDFCMYCIDSSISLVETSIKEKSWIDFFNNSNFDLHNKRKNNLGYGKKRNKKEYTFKRIEIYELKNKVNGKRFLTTYANYMNFQGGCIDALETNVHRNKELQDDWNNFGHDNFSFNKLFYGLNDDYQFNYYKILDNYNQLDYTKPKIINICLFDTSLLDKYYIGMKPKKKKKKNYYRKKKSDVI